jgi:hypothetical protein
MIASYILSSATKCVSKRMLTSVNVSLKSLVNFSIVVASSGLTLHLQLCLLNFSCGLLQWRSQDLHMEGVGRAKRDRHGRSRQRRRRPCWGWVREGVAPSRKGVRGYHPRENFTNLTTLMCILETEIFTFVLHVHS